MEDADVYAISVEVAPRFLDDQSAPEDGRFAFAYTIRIHNQGRVAARLVARHWRITDANGRVEHVDGDGVIGEQPRLRPGEDFRYTSGVMLGTDHGTMQGTTTWSPTMAPNSPRRSHRSCWPSRAPCTDTEAER